MTERGQRGGNRGNDVKDKIVKTEEAQGIEETTLGTETTETDNETNETIISFVITL